MASIQSDLNRLGEVEIDGVRPAATLTPRTADEVAEILGTADREGHAIAPVGGGTKLVIGNVPQRLDFALSTAALDRVIHYEPTDLTLSVQAGMRFADVQALLADKGQTLPVEVADADRATIGGLIATAVAGPRRLGSGTLRDLLIGIAVAYPSGIVGKAGGLVVKNVTGFDLMRLHLGALGTLGVILSANFKVLPAARHEATSLSKPQSLDDAFALAATARQGRLRPIAVEMLSSDEGWITAVRFEGRPETVTIGTADLHGSASWDRVVEGDESRDWWRQYVDGQSLASTGEATILRCGFAPKVSAVKVPLVMAVLASHDISPEHLNISPGLGAVTARIEIDVVGAGVLRTLQTSLLEVVESATILAAPASLKADIDVWGRVPGTVSVMRALKAEFDPHNVLNPGRFIDRI
jgi:glycolate oxidase FAD binding subunit